MSIVYFDNAATSFPKPAPVIDEVKRCLLQYCGNPGRSAHSMSMRAAEEIYKARECISDFFKHSTPESVVFTYNATYALNFAIKSMIPPNSHVIISDIEHNAVVRPLYTLCESGYLKYSHYNTSGNIYSEIKKLILPETVAIISTIKSNVTGREIDIDLLSRICSENDLKLIVDASQFAGHKVLDLSKIKFDAVCAPGHKGLFGIQGCGFAIFKDKIRGRSIIEGGSGSDSMSKTMPLLLPDGYEAGTLATPAIISVTKGIESIEKIGMPIVEERLEQLTQSVLNGLDTIGGVDIYSEGPGIVSFNVKEIPAFTVAELLADQKIYTRSGLHCAPLAHQKLGTVERGTVRVSLSCYNTEREVSRLIHAVRDISKIL